MIIKKILKIVYAWIKLTLHGVTFNYRVSGKGFYIYNKGSIIISEKVNLNSYPDGSCHRTALSTYYPEAEIRIGNNCNLNGTAVHCNEKITIGNYCMFGPGTIISDNDSHRVVVDPKLRREKAESRPIVIKDNVWVGMNCIILKGVTIGENSIIAAGSVIVKDVPPNSLAGGNPGKILKQLE